MLLTLTIGVIIFGDKLFNGNLLDLQIHDTYYIFRKYFLLTAIFIFLLISIYLNRLIYWKSNKRVFSILTIIVLVVFLIGLVNYTNWIYGYSKDYGYYTINEKTQTERISEFTMTFWILTIMTLTTIVTIATTGYKIARPKNS